VWYRFTAKARADLRDIAAYTLQQWGPAQCDDYLEGIRACCSSIVQRPELRRPSRDFPPYFRVLQGKHAIFYPLDEDGWILVVRILHAVMNPELHLPEAEDEDEDDDA
jgi:toxin ParE1/3/4